MILIMNGNDNFVFTLEDLIIETYKTKENIINVNKKSKGFSNYKKDKILTVNFFIKKFANNINQKYIDKVCKSNNRILFLSKTGLINYEDIIATIIDRKILKVKGKVRYVIFIFAVLPKFRSMGYGKDSLIKYYDFIKKSKKITEIVLHSLKESINFYTKVGYKEIQINFFLQYFEGLKENDDYKFFKIILPIT